MATSNDVNGYQLTKEEELRFDVGSGEVLLEVTDGDAEMFGLKLKRFHKYALPASFRGAVFTYNKATVEIVGKLDSVYTANAGQSMTAYSNVSQGLTDLRKKAKKDGTRGPIVMVVGPRYVGKTTLVKMFCNYAVRNEDQVLLVDLDCGQNGVFPGCITALGVESSSSLIHGFDITAPFAFAYGHMSPTENTKLYDLMVDNLAGVVKAKLDTHPRFRSGGAIIDTCAWTKGDYYSSIVKAAESFDVSLVIVLDHERMFSALQNDLPTFVNVVHLPKSGGAEPLSGTQELQIRNNVIQRYFYGTKTDQLFPRSYMFSYDKPREELELKLCRLGTDPIPESCLPYGMKADDHQTMVEFVPYSASLNNRIIAFIEDVQPLGTAAIRKPVRKFGLIKSVDPTEKFVELLLPDDELTFSLAVLTDVTFTDDMVDRL